jgi:hypothetical protein
MISAKTHLWVPEMQIRVKAAAAVGARAGCFGVGASAQTPLPDWSMIR